MKFLSPEVALYLYKSTIWPCMEYCCHVWAGAPSCYLEMVDKLQKQICRTVGPSLGASLEPLAQCRNDASLSFSIGITLADVYLNWLNWFHIYFMYIMQKMRQGDKFETSLFFKKAMYEVKASGLQLSFNIF